jgi:lipoprotein-anchoring transpeptidase ErfK/SrfK
MRRWNRVGAAVLVTVVAVTALTGFHAASSGPASTTTDHAAVSDLVRVPVMAPSSAPSGTHHAAAASSPCVHSRQAQLVVVSIKRQHEWACAHGRTVMRTPVTTGATSRPGDATPRGTFAVQGLDRDTVLSISTGARYRVKYWIPFHLGVWGFHDASWQAMPFGSKHYVTRGSHGCVHMPLAAIRWLFHWVRYGTLVRIT